MADYKSSILRVLKIEGGYSNDPSDNGGETYKGISRKFWPDWVGWRIIDQHKSDPNFPKILNKDTYLYDLVIGFFKKNFWDRIGGDFMDSQNIAELLMDSAVNEGITPAIKRAQGIVGLPQTGKISNELVQKLNMLK